MAELKEVVQRLSGTSVIDKIIVDDCNYKDSRRAEYLEAVERDYKRFEEIKALLGIPERMATICLDDWLDEKVATRTRDKFYRDHPERRDTQ